MNMFLFFVIVAMSTASVFAGSTSYGLPSQDFGAPVLSGITGGYDNGQGAADGGQVHRHVYIHVGENEPVDSQSRIIRVPSNPDKHVNIIFVKAPSSSSQQNTEVILPEQPQQKTLVYVLVKKSESSSDVKIRGPAPTRPSKPEVYFIRYKGQESSGSDSSYGPPGYEPSSAYGAP